MPSVSSVSFLTPLGLVRQYNSPKPYCSPSIIIQGIFHLSKHLNERFDRFFRKFLSSNEIQKYFWTEIGINIIFDALLTTMSITITINKTREFMLFIRYFFVIICLHVIYLIITNSGVYIFLKNQFSSPANPPFPPQKLYNIYACEER